MKKILIFCRHYYPETDDLARTVREIARRLGDFDYYVISAKAAKTDLSQEQKDNIQIYRVGRASFIDKYLYLWRALGLGKRLHQTIHFDFVWSLGPRQTGLAAWFFKYWTKVLYLLTIQSAADVEVWTAIYKQAKVIQVTSRYLGQRSRDRGAKGEIYVVPSGLDESVFSPALESEQRAKRRQELGLDQDNFVLLARADRDAAHLDDLIRALNFLIYKNGLPVALIIYGQSSEDYNLLRLAQKVAVEEYVIWAPDENNKPWRDYLAISDVFVDPSGAPDVSQELLQAMAMGVPVVAVAAGAVADILDNETNGLACVVEHPASVALAVEKYYRDGNLHQQVRTQAHNLIQAKYHWDIIVSKMEKIFREKM